MHALPGKLLAGAAGLTLLATTLLAADPPAGTFDFGSFTPPAAGGEYVEVNLRGNLLAMAARLIAREEPDVAELVRGIQGVRVNVVSLDDQNRAEIQQRLGDIRRQLTAQGWDRVVTAQTGSEDVGVYLRTRGDEAVEGVAVTVIEGNRQAVFVNVVGDIRPEKLAELGERLGIEPLKEAGLKVKRAGAK
jgi:virulence-associated protein VapD